MNRAAPRPPPRPVGGEGELSTGTGALLVLLVIWMATEAGHRRLR
jgi:hypothetical protein